MGKVVKKIGRGIGDFFGDVTGSGRAAEAAQGSALAQAAASERIASEQRALFRENRDQLLGEAGRLEREALLLAEADPNELRDLETAFSESERLLAREEKFLNAIDPALMEASEQTLKLLRGEEADINKPTQNLRARQRQQLVDSLRSQFGPGAESSSIGRQALSEFDTQTSLLASQNRQNSLSQVFGIATSDIGGRARSAFGQRAGLAGQLSQGKTNQRLRLLNTRLGVGQSTIGALSGTNQQQLALESNLGQLAIQNAGAPFVGEALKGQPIVTGKQS